MPDRLIALTLVSWLVGFAMAAGLVRAEEPLLQTIEADPARGVSAAVLVPDADLVITRQFLPPRRSSPADAVGVATAAERQAIEVLDSLATMLAEVGSGLDRCARLNWYIREPADAEGVHAAMRRTFSDLIQPTMTLVVTPLADSDALVGVDAVAIGTSHGTTVGRQSKGHDGGAARLGDVAVVPRGGRVFVAGQAEPGDLAEATRNTLASLSRTLAYLELSDAHFAQLKCFVHPVEQADLVHREIAAHFGDAVPPPVTLVGWKSDLPIEIELLAWGGPAVAGRPEIEYVTPPGMTASPLYSRVARTNGGELILFSDMFGPAGSAASDQITAAFERLGLLCEKTGTDLASLAKATYYVVDDEVGAAHNQIRPQYYDPARPPAASKAIVSGTGRSGVRYVMDMIAAPSSRGSPDSAAERGHGLSAAEAALGWLSLFDGESPFGWQQATVEDRRLCGGKSTTRFGPSELRVLLDGPGTVRFGDRSVESAGGELRITTHDGSAQVELVAGAMAESVLLRPLDLPPLFNGSNLDGWRRIDRTADDPAARWDVEGQRLHVFGGPGALEYQGQLFGDFVAQLDIRTRSVHSNGGLFFRAIPGDFMNGYEAQIHNRAIDRDPARPYVWATGGIDDRQNPRRLASRDFVPFRMTIIADGPHVATWINGMQTVDWTDDRPAHENPREGLRLDPGAIQLQAHDPATDYELLGIWAGPLN